MAIPGIMFGMSYYIIVTNFREDKNVHFQSVKSPHLPFQVEDLGGPDVALEAVRVTRGHRQDQEL